MSALPEDYSWEADAVGSFAEAIREIGRRVKAGKEPLPTTGLFRATAVRMRGVPDAATNSAQANQGMANACRRGVRRPTVTMGKSDSDRAGGAF